MALKIVRAWRRFTPEASGNSTLPAEEQVGCEYRTMTVGDVFRVQEDTGVDMTRMQSQGTDLVSMKVNWDLMEYILSKYTRDWKGIEVDGVAVGDAKQIVESVGMSQMGLFAEVVGVIVTESMGVGDEAKNLVGQSGPESSGFISTADPASPSNSSPPETAAAAG